MKKMIWTMALVFAGTWTLGSLARAEEGAKATPVASPSAKKAVSKNAKSSVKVVYTCSMDPDVMMDKPGKCPKCGMDLVKKEVKEEKGKKTGVKAKAVEKSEVGAKKTYACEMCHVTSPKPGKCPMCGMAMVEVKEEGKPAKN